MAGPKKSQQAPNGDAIDRAAAATEAPQIARVTVPLPRGRSAVALFPFDIVPAEVLAIEDHLHDALAQLTRERREREPHLVVPAGRAGQILRPERPA